MEIQIWPFSEFSMDFGQVDEAEYSYSNSEYSKIARTFKFFWLRYEILNYLYVSQ